MHLNITVAKNAGFCFGVKRAIKLATETAQLNNEPVYTFGPIIHNPQMVARMEEQGVLCIDTISQIASDQSIVIIRSHGISPKIFNELRERDITVIDATCPLVKKLQRRVELLRSENYQIIIIGEADHPEVKVLKEYGGPHALVMKNTIHLDQIQETRSVGVVAQTTLLLSTLQNAVSTILTKSRDIKIYNTICDATTQRQQAANDLTVQSDIMLVVGGKNSSNTNRLAEICRASGKPTHHIETFREIKASWFTNNQSIGLTAGASTPDWIIAETIKMIQDL